MSELSPILQFGFAATMAYLIWRAYAGGQDKMLQVVEKNSEALQKVAGVVDNSTRVNETLVRKIGDLEIRLVTLEQCTHGDEGHAGCPVLSQHIKETSR